jgi:hypothetical protein
MVAVQRDVGVDALHRSVSVVLMRASAWLGVAMYDDLPIIESIRRHKVVGRCESTRTLLTRVCQLVMRPGEA